MNEIAITENCTIYVLRTGHTRRKLSFTLVYTEFRKKMICEIIPQRNNMYINQQDAQNNCD